MALVKVAQLSEIPEGSMIAKEHADKDVLIANVGGTLYAMSNICTHQGAPLHEGELGTEGECLVTCPWHEAHFDLRSGEVHQDTPWATPAETYEVKVEGDDVYVEL